MTYLTRIAAAVALMFSLTLAAPAGAEPLGNLPSGEPIQRLSAETQWPKEFRFKAENFKMVKDTVEKAIRIFGKENGVTNTNPLSERESQCLYWRFQYNKTKLEYGWQAQSTNPDPNMLTEFEANFDYARKMMEYWCGGGTGGRGLAIFDNYTREHSDQMVEDLTRAKGAYWDAAVKGLELYAKYKIFTTKLEMEVAKKHVQEMAAKAKNDPTVQATLTFLVAAGAALNPITGM